MPFGLVILFVVAALVYFGLAHRVLDRMRLTDTQALAFLGLMVAGSFFTLPLASGLGGGAVDVSVNVGGVIVPLALVIYLIAKADTTVERVRPLAAAAVTGLAIIAAGRLMGAPPHSENVPMMLDPVWFYSALGGVVGYLAGRSRRSAFIAGTLGVILADIGHLLQAAGAGTRSDVALGGAGVFDAVVVAGVLSVGLAEIFGETRERLQGGPRVDEDTPEALKRDEGGHDE